MKNAIQLLLFITLVSVASCEKRESGEFYYPNDKLGDYAQGRNKPYGPNAKGEEIAASDFEGDYLWVYYSAPWCSSCRSQAPQVKQALAEFPDDVSFLNVITSGNAPSEPSTKQTAASMASQSGFDPEFVVAEGNSFRIVPQHAFFGPDGKTLFRYLGWLSKDEIIKRIKAR